MMFLGLVLSVVSLGSAMANDANLSLERKPKSPKKVVINVNVPPVGGGAEYFNPGGCPPPPPKECDCKVVVKHHKRGHNHSKFNKPRPPKKHHCRGEHRPDGAPIGAPVGASGGSGEVPNGAPGGRK